MVAASSSDFFLLAIIDGRNSCPAFKELAEGRLVGEVQGGGDLLYGELRAGQQIAGIAVEHLEDEVADALSGNALYD